MNQDGRIYIGTVGGITYGVEIADLGEVLGRGTTDLGLLCSDQEWYDNNGTQALRDAGLINKWAKYKPVRSAALRVLTNEDRAEVYWGLSITPYSETGYPTTPNSFLNKLINGQLPWEYLKPRGASYSPKEWFRLRDFENYYHYCICPVGEPVTESVIDSSGNTTIAWDKPSLPTGNLDISDIKVYSGGVDYDLEDFYLCLLLVRGSTYNIVVSTTAIGGNDVQINISNADQYAGAWRAYPFLSSVRNPSEVSNGVLVSAGWDEPYMDISFRRSVDSLSIVAYGTWNDDYTAISIEWHATNQDSATKTPTPTIDIYKNTTGATPTGSDNPVNPTPFSLGQITVPGASGGNPGTATGTAIIQFTAGADHDDYYWFLGVHPGAPYNTAYAQIEDPEGDPNANI